jgi:hypothetical protein
MNIIEAPFLKRLKFEDNKQNVSNLQNKRMNPDNCNQVAVYFFPERIIGSKISASLSTLKKTGLLTPSTFIVINNYQQT